MRNLNYLNKFRIPLGGCYGDEFNGAFLIPQKKFIYQVVASNGAGWEHVSVSLKTFSGHQLERLPRWEEMCEVKNMFFETNEAVMQLHPKEEDYINENPWVLHLWRPLEKELPLPPTILVGRIRKKNQSSNN